MTTHKVDPMAKARTRLLLKYPWYGQLVLRLKTKVMENDPQVQTAATDGVYLYYNPQWFEKLNDAERLFTLAHEVRHCALLHMTRRGNRDAMLWNIAADYRINADLKAEGIGTMPQGGLYDPIYGDDSSEKIYYTLLKQGKDKTEKKVGQGWNFGGIMDAPPQGGKDGKDKQGSGQGNEPGNGQGKQASSTGSLENDWKVAVEQATVTCRKAGRESQGAELVMQAIREPKNDWRDIFRKYITVMSDYSWSKPNRRFSAQGVYLPSAVKQRLRHVIFILDTSGSIACSPELMAKLASEGCGIMQQADAWPERVTVMCVDAEVKSAYDCTDVLEFHPVGGGGTAFQPAFDYIQQQDWTPEVVFYMTDLECFDKPSKPDYDVVWIVPREYVKPFSFGEVVGIDE